jgi:hypothetical protein
MFTNIHIPTRFSFELTFLDKLECNLALATTTEPMQDEDTLLLAIIGEVCMHLRENVSSASKDSGWRRAAFQSWLLRRSNPTYTYV